MGEKKHINKIPQKIPGQSRDILFTCFFFMCFFSLPKTGQTKIQPLNPKGKLNSQFHCALQGRRHRSQNTFIETLWVSRSSVLLFETDTGLVVNIKQLDCSVEMT